MKDKSSNVVWHRGSVSAEDREKLNGHKGGVLWFTGLPSSGKSTLAFALERALHERGCRSYVLDGDNVRHGLNKDLGFSPEDRAENIRRLGEVAKLFADSGTIVMTAFISPYAADRNRARELQRDGHFVEIYCRCPVSACETRDPKGLYRKARAGEIKDFTGVSAPYEEPEKPELVLDTDRESIGDCVARIQARLEEKGILPRSRR